MRCMLIARIYGGCGCVCCSVGGLSETESRTYVCGFGMGFGARSTPHSGHCARTERLVPYPFRARHRQSPGAAAGPVPPAAGGPASYPQQNS
jgi:hypothetical protein